MTPSVVTNVNNHSTRRAAGGWRWLRGAISIALLSWLAAKLNWRELSTIARGLRWEWVALACAIHIANRLLTAAKWQVLLRAKRISFPYLYLVRVVWISNFFGHFLPAVVGGDSVRMLTMARESDRAPEVVSSVLMERLTGVTALAALAVLGAIWSVWSWGTRSVLVAVTLPLGVLFVGLGLLWTTPGARLLGGLFARLPGRRSLTQVHEAIRSYRHQPAAVLSSLAISLALQVNRVVIVHGVARALGIHLLFSQALVLVPPVLFISMLPISVSGWGVQEGAFVLLFRLAGIGTSAAFVLSIVHRMIAIASNLPGAALFFTRGLGRGQAPIPPVSAATIGARSTWCG